MKLIKGFQKAATPSGSIGQFRGCHFEEKLDGTRIQVVITANEFWAYTRRISKESGYYNERTEELSHLAQDFKHAHYTAGILGLIAPTDIIILDGEAAHPDRTKGFIPIHSVTHRGEHDYFVYDIVALGEADILGYKEYVRRDLIEQLCEGCNRIHLTPRHDSPAPFFTDPEKFNWALTLEDMFYFKVEGDVEVVKSLIKDELEGFIIKDPNARYIPEGRQGWWKGKKCGHEDVMATGWLPGTGKYSEIVGKLQVQSMDGKRTSTASGMTDAERVEMMSWPYLCKIEIMYQERTDTSWRHPRYKRRIYDGE